MNLLKQFLESEKEFLVENVRYEVFESYKIQLACLILGKFDLNLALSLREEKLGIYFLWFLFSH
jgi:hypothetical protein